MVHWSRPSMGASTSFHFRASNASWYSGIHWSVIFLFFLGLVEPVASIPFNGFAILANPLTCLQRYNIILSNLRQLLDNMAHWSRPSMGASTSFHFRASKANPLTYLRRYDIRPRNWQTVLWVIGIGKSSTALIFYESFSTPFAETVWPRNETLLWM